MGLCTPDVLRRGMVGVSAVVTRRYAHNSGSADKNDACSNERSGATADSGTRARARVCVWEEEEEEEEDAGEEEEEEGSGARGRE